MMISETAILKGDHTASSARKQVELGKFLLFSCLMAKIIGMSRERSSREREMQKTLILQRFIELPGRRAESL